MWAVKLCSNKIIQFLTGCASKQVVLYNCHKMVVVVAAVATVQSYAHVQLMGLLFLSYPTLDLVPKREHLVIIAWGFFPSQMPCLSPN